MKSTYSAASITLNLSGQTMPLSFFQSYVRQLSSASFAEKLEQMFSGDIVNPSEGRPALHTALRSLSSTQRSHPLYLEGRNVSEQVDDCHQLMRKWAHKITSGAFQPSGSGISDWVHIGVGGSSLGPQLCHHALLAYHQGAVRIHFITVIDSDVMDRLLSVLQPATTAFFVVSKSFTTEETMQQAQRAKQWLASFNLAPDKHFFAATTNSKRALQWGVPQEQILPFWSWVGGRFSLWSSVGFSLVLALGMDSFCALLKGAHAMDVHFKEAPLAENIPVILAALSIWHTEKQACPMHAVIPYTEKLSFLIPYLQQLHMESLGKTVTHGGRAVESLASPVLFGDVATRSQHALSQYFMQSKACVPQDMIYLETDSQNSANERLLAHVFAQSEVLKQGYQDKEHAFKNIAAHQPHSLISLKSLTPHTLGALLAMYEHKVFALGVYYDINLFDQWGVERGKHIAKARLAALQEQQTS